ncbi:PucR family transcriptional regulator [Nonomuraea sp. NPDC050328]|uniref:PucR family transcriptional regulator n=1 Tax=Nonomuraea sp. NPDC050328 TaxID=3364361 RepID=UPI0037A2D8C8
MDGAEARARVPLDLLITQVGEGLLEVLSGPSSVEVSGTTVFGDPPPPGSLVLMVGLDPAGPATAEGVRGLRGAAAAVVGPCRDEAVGPLVAAAREAGVALLRMRWALAWTHLFTMADDLTGGRDAGGVAGDLGGVPPGDLPALAGAMGAALNRPVLLVDTQWRLLAYSAHDLRTAGDLMRETVLNRIVPEAEALPQMRRELLRDGRARRLGRGASGRIGAGVLAGGVPYGMLWVIDGEAPLPDDRLELVERFARLAATHLGQARAVRRRQGELAGLAVEGGEGAAGACRELGLDPAEGLTVVAVGSRADVPGGVLLESLAAHLEGYRRPAACALRGDTVCLVLGPRAREFAADAVGRPRGRRRLVAGVGGQVWSAEELPRSARQAALVLDVLLGRPDGPAVASVDDVRTEAAIGELRHLLGDRTDLLVHRLPAEPWMLAWLEAGGDYRAAADRLDVHPNTLRYRVRKLAESGLDLHDPDVRLATWLRLRLAHRPSG